MQFIGKSDARYFQNSSSCTAIEYAFDNSKDINNAVIILDGRYPDSGHALNHICKEVIYIIEGVGLLFSDAKSIRLHTGDMVQIEPNERYYFSGTMTMLIASTPAWYPAQYETGV